MATSNPKPTTRQQRLGGNYEVLDYDLGDLLVDTATGSNSQKLSLVECPMCATDPQRPRYHFREQESRAAHIAAEHE